MTRSCGSCTTCCYVMEIEDLGKPNRQMCQHQCKSGCAIYQAKPVECTGFDCSWLSGIVRADYHRPDLVNLVVWPMPEGSWPHQLKILNVTEVVDGARNAPEGKSLIEELLFDGWTLLVRSSETHPMLQYHINLATEGSEHVFDRLAEAGFCIKTVSLRSKKAA